VAVASPPKEARVFGDSRFVMEEAINADYALVHARLGDTDGNLVFNKTVMNFNPLAAMAGRITIAQVEELVDVGDIDPSSVHLPGMSVQRVVHTGPQDKHIEKRTVRTEERRNR
jgi:3-oxoacid CoA-transferase subunit A